MAAFNYDDFSEPSDGGSLQSMINWAGAGLSILLIAGLATWGWKLWQRDVTGIPVVRALEGPMRVAPEDPGGLASEYQGLAVNRIAEERLAEPTDRVALAPEPAALDEAEDLPMAEMAPVALPMVEADAAPTFTAEPEVASAAVEEVPLAIEAVAAAEPEPAPASAPSATDLAVAAALAATGDIVVESSVAALEGVPLATPRPIARPADRRVASLSPVMNDVTGEIDPASIPVGTRLVQLGAYGSPEVARAEWANAIANFGDYMVGKDRVVQEAETGGRTFWRLRAMGFDNLTDARRFCAVLVADGANCIPVVQE